MAGLSEKSVEHVLKDVGLTEREVEIYVFLAKHGILKSREIARHFRKDNALLDSTLLLLLQKRLSSQLPLNSFIHRYSIINERVI